MKKQKKFVITMIIFLVILSLGNKIVLANSEDYAKMIEQLEEADNVTKTKREITNPLKLVNALNATVDTKYSLKDLIPANMIIKNQQQTNSSWAFASIGALESTLALKDYKKGISPVTYDFSERHMEYATSMTFKDGINPKGFNREVGDKNRVNVWMATSYLTNGMGAVLEKDMPFENNDDKVELKQIDKNNKTQINDTITMLKELQGDNKTLLKQKIKELIKNNGGVATLIHGVSSTDESYYNKKTGALYCDDNEKYPTNHYALIIGWDDNYSKNNFVVDKKPQNDGAWIVRDSFGTGIGDNGIIYVSYEDVNVYDRMLGIMDAQTDITYENIYQYDQYAPTGSVVRIKKNKIYLATVFDKKTSGTEYLNQVSIYAPEKYTCKVYVNPNGTSKAKDDMQQMNLKTGETITFEAGYHTIEFSEPIEITGNNFVVMIEIQGENEKYTSVEMEYNFAEYIKDLETPPAKTKDWLNNVTVESGKCFYSYDGKIESNEWIDTSTMKEVTKGSTANFDTTIKAFTRSTLEPNILQSIEITTPPSKTSYIVGENFDKTGMVVKAKYSDGTSKEITDYTIKNGTNLEEDQSSITVEYNWKTATQEIEVKAKEPEKAITSINIKAKPTKTEYIQNKEELDLTGGIIEAIYNDGSKTNVPMNSNNVTVSGFNNKVLGKNTITVEYEKKTAQFDVEIKAEEQKPIVLERIEIATPPSKTSYIVGENFDKTGMIVKAKYSDGTSKEVTNYTIKNGMNLVEGQSSVTIEYNGKTVSQTINVKAKEQKPSVEKTITAISIKTKPAKTEYIQNKEQLDLTGGSIEVTYSDGSKTEISMNSSDVIVSGFNNKVLGKNTITVTYKEKTAQFDIEIKEEKKDDDNKGNVDVKKPQNSNFDNMQVKVTKMKSYDFTDTSKKEYSIISVDISNITFANENDKMEYYYYLSSNPNESNIGKWIKIENIDKKDNKISFEINTSDISNYEEVSKANDVYLYIKEIAILNNAEQEKITKSSKLEVSNINIEKYIDGKKKEDVNSDTIVNPTPGKQNPNNSSDTEKTDKTIATEILPKAGKGMLMIGLILILAIVGRITYKKYKNIQIK